MIKTCLLMTVVVSLASGCATLVYPDVEPVGPIDVSKHLIYVDAQGDLIDPLKNEKVVAVRQRTLPLDDTSRSCAKQSNATPEQAELWRKRRAEQEKEMAYVKDVIDHYFAEKEKNGNLQPVLHIHGGLNTLDGVVKRAKLLPGYMMLDGHYPIMLGWPSGFLRSYKNHLVKSDRGRERSALGTVFFGSMTYVQDVVRSIAAVPTSLVRQVDNMLMVPIQLDSEEEQDARVRGPARLRAAGFTVANPGPYVGVGETYFPFIINPVGWLATPLRDGLGSGAWDAMLRQTELVLTKASVFEGNALPVNPCADIVSDLEAQPGDTAATLFMLAWQKDRRTANIPVTVIGHSMGAIVTLQMLSRHPGMDFRNVVFMAGAARIKDVQSILIPWMATHPHSRFFNLSLDPYNEIAERTYYDFVPRGSLLMWIDDTFGTVNSFRDRTIGKWWNVLRIAEDLFPSTYAIGPVSSSSQPNEAVPIRSRVVLKRFPIMTNGSLGPQTHGDFNQYCFWRKDFWQSEDKGGKPLFGEAVFARENDRLKDSCAHNIPAAQQSRADRSANLPDLQPNAAHE